MKRIINTTENTIEVQISGKTYTLSPLGFLDVPETVCTYWRENLHNFLGEMEVPEVKEVKEIKKENIEEKVEEINTVVEKVKKIIKKK